jgi:transposase
MKIDSEDKISQRRDLLDQFIKAGKYWGHRSRLAKEAGVSRNHLYKLAKRANNLGLDAALDPGRHGRPPIIFILSKSQAREVVALVMNDPHAFTNSKGTWTVASLKKWIAQRFRVHLADHTLRRFLKKVGFVWNLRGHEDSRLLGNGCWERRCSKDDLATNLDNYFRNRRSGAPAPHRGRRKRS